MIRFTGTNLRLITKINSYFAVILIFLMASVFIFTQFFMQTEFQAQVERSLQVTLESFKLTLDNINIVKEQQATAIIQTRGDALGISTRDRLSSVLYYYLNLTAADYNLKLIEVTDGDGYLLADNRQPYEAGRIRLRFPGAAFGPAAKAFYLSKRGAQFYLITTLPIVYAGKRVGYLNLGTRLDHSLVAYFSSVLHTKLLFYGGDRFLIGTASPIAIPAAIRARLQHNPAQSIFLPGAKITNKNYDYVFVALPSDPEFDGIVAIANSRSEVRAALLRLKIFLWALAGFGLVFGSICANLLARNIKKSIFGMEPQEIASLLDQRTTILQSTFEGIIALDQEGRITLVNQEAKQLLPSDLEIIGQPAENLFLDLKIKEVLQTGRAVYNQRQIIGETIIVFNCVPIKTKYKILGAVITLRDLTEFQKVAEELVAVKNYTQALRSQSHEFMNKLQSISGLIQLGKYETALTLLHETSESHQDLISLLNHAFSTSAVSGILLGKYNRAKELNIDFEIDPESHIPQGVFVPDNELVCIVGNLIENAFEALQESRQDLKKVWVKIYPWKTHLKIVICDNGPGISAAIRNQIFERGFTTKKGQNKGIGLSIVKQSVANLRGVIRVYSRKQTFFVIKIPIRNGGV